MSNLAKIQKRQSIIQESMISVQRQMLQDRSTVHEVLTPCLQHLGLLLEAELVTVYMNVSDMHCHVTPGERDNLKIKKRESCNDGHSREVPMEVLSWQDDNLVRESIKAGNEERRNQLEIVPLDENCYTASENGQIIISGNNIYVPLIKSLGNESKIVEQRLGKNNNNDGSNDILVVAKDNLQASNNLTQQQKQHKNLGVICIKKPDNSNQLTIEEISAIKQVSLLASLGLKHVRVLRNLEISHASDQIKKSVISFLSQPKNSQIDEIYNKVFSQFSEDNMVIFHMGKLDTINFPSLEKSEDELVIYAVRMIKYLIEFVPEDGVNSKLTRKHSELKRPLLEDNNNNARRITENRVQRMTEKQLRSLCSFMYSTRTLYRPVSYHNWRHVFNVAQTIFFLITQTQLKNLLTKIEKISLLISGFCHDLDHRGMNNQFQKLSDSELWRMHGTSTLEKHHVDMTMMLLDEEHAFLPENSSLEQAKSIIEHAILSTDLRIYFARKPSIAALVEKTKENFIWNEVSIELLRALIMTSSDLIAIAKPWHVQFQVAFSIYDEFFNQGDASKSYGLEPSGSSNREEVRDMPKFQLGFIKAICEPVYTSLDQMFCDCQVITDAVKTNETNWTDYQNGKISAPTKIPFKDADGNFVFEV